MNLLSVFAQAPVSSQIIFCGFSFSEWPLQVALVGSYDKLALRKIQLHFRLVDLPLEPNANSTRIQTAELIFDRLFFFVADVAEWDGA